jgi:hypothetical protein
VVVPLKAVEHPRDGIWVLVLVLVLAVADYRTRDNRLRASSGALDRACAAAAGFCARPYRSLSPCLRCAGSG